MSCLWIQIVKNYTRASRDIWYILTLSILLSFYIAKSSLVKLVPKINGWVTAKMGEIMGKLINGQTNRKNQEIDKNDKYEIINDKK